MSHEVAPRPPVLVPTIALLATALWLGSLAHLLLSVASLFKTFPRLASNVAIEGAPVLFHVSERYHVGLAGLAIVGGVVWLRRSPSRLLGGALAALLVAALLALLQIGIVTPRMSAASAVEDRATFNRLHGVSNVQYLAQTVLVLAATLTLPAALARPTLTPAAALTRSASSPGTAPAARPD